MFFFEAVYLSMFGKYKQTMVKASCGAVAEEIAIANRPHELDEFQFVKMVID